MSRRGPYPEPLVVERRQNPCSWEHAHRQTRWPVVALAVLMLLITVMVVILTLFVSNFSDYVAGRGEYRDREAARLDERIDRVVCDILQEFPVGDARADRLRLRYGCPLPAEAQ